MHSQWAGWWWQTGIDDYVDAVYDEMMLNERTTNDYESLPLTNKSDYRAENFRPLNWNPTARVQFVLNDDEETFTNVEPPINTEVNGGSRFSSGKPRGFWFGPYLGLRLVQKVADYGGRKYAPKDWREGQSFSTLIDCAFRHLLAILDEGPWSKDEESGFYHAAHAAWNLLALLTFMEKGRSDLDDVSKWDGVTAAAKAEKGLSYP